VKTLVEMKNVVKEFPVGSNVFRKKGAVVHAVSGVSFDIIEGETFALVGESGCGKSTLGRLMLNLIPLTSGEVVFDGDVISKYPPDKMGAMRKNMQIIFQDPYASLNPRMNIRNIMAEPLVTHNVCKTREEMDAKIRGLLVKVGMRPQLMTRFPHQFSGGQRQRVGIARALALNPKLIVCDEPVSALDVSIQSQILNLLADLQKEMGLTYLFISHDLSVVRYLSDRVCVMFLGKICELGATRDIYSNPLHPYTKFLLESVPKPDPTKRREKEVLSGEIPSPVNPPSGCRFHTRCPIAKDQCSQEEPAIREISGHKVACHFA
jgi:oligopeptide/dipeptide ABC transporter ATP-binding protein